MRGRGGFQRVSRLITVGVGLVYGAPSLDAIGLRGRFSGAALYAEFSDVVAAVGGGTMQSEPTWFQ
jgi:hypothetical protein